jgi:hypothetical protein
MTIYNVYSHWEKSLFIIQVVFQSTLDCKRLLQGLIYFLIGAMLLCKIVYKTLQWNFVFIIKDL